jgi:hypothetical protein
MDDNTSLKALRQRAAQSVHALAAHAWASKSGAALHPGPLTSACRRALRNVLQYKTSRYVARWELEVVQEHFIRLKLLPPVEVVVTGSLDYPDRVVAEFQGVLAGPLTVQLQWKVSFHDYLPAVCRMKASGGGKVLWATNIPYGFGFAFCLDTCVGPFAVLVLALVRYMQFHNPETVLVVPPALAPMDRFYTNVRHAFSVQDTWAAVRQGLSQGLTAATVVPWRQPADVVKAHLLEAYSRHDQGHGLVPHMWVLLAAGAKPRALLQCVELFRFDFDLVMASVAAASVLAGADCARPMWSCSRKEYLRLWRRFPGDAPISSVATLRVILAWPEAPNMPGFEMWLVSFDRKERWSPCKAAWCRAAVSL